MRVGAASRIGALAFKDVADLWRNPGAIVPPVSMALGALVPAFLVVVAAPAASGEVLGDSSEFASAAQQAVGVIPELAGLDGSALVQAFLFHQFGLLLLLVPIVGAMALAAHAVIGEKTARTLEPLLATPLSTAELLAAKTATPFVFATLLLWGTWLLYLGGIGLIGEPGVWRTFLGTRSLLQFVLLGPLLSLVALLVAVIVSSRVADARSAQQLGAFVVLPVSVGFVVQLVGGFVIGPRVLLLFALVLVLLVGGLLWLGVRVFGRERILMRWK